MGYMIEIKEKKVEKLSEHIEEGLKHLGKAMQCVEEWMEEGGNYGERDEQDGRYGNRGMSYGNRYNDMKMRGSRGGSMGYRDDDDDWDEMSERRGMRRR